jgi:DnaJ-class molecular chaperone
MKTPFKTCDVCFNSIIWKSCPACNGERQVENINGPMVECDTCDGNGGWYSCPTCEARKNAQRVTTQRRLGIQ